MLRDLETDPRSPVPWKGGAASGDYRVVIHSIGSAGCGLVGALRRTLPFSEERLASLLLQAPSELVTDISREPAEKISALLREAGLEASVESTATPFSPGDAGYEVALVVRDLDRVAEVVQQVMEVLGCDVETAKGVLWHSPAVLLGKISAATVAALCQRFEPLGVELDVSRPEEASYDVFVGDCSAESRRRLTQAVREAGATMVSPTEPPQPLLATGLSEAQAHEVWRRFGRSGLPLHLVNRDFERYDVRLHAAPQTPELRDYLAASTGMPAELVPKVIASLPVVIHQNVPFAFAGSCLPELANLGARATADLLTFQTFALVIESLRDPEKTLQVVRAVAGDDAVTKGLGPLPIRIPGPLSPLRARLLHHELSRIGATGRLELR